MVDLQNKFALCVRLPSTSDLPQRFSQNWPPILCHCSTPQCRGFSFIQ